MCVGAVCCLVLFVTYTYPCVNSGCAGTLSLDLESMPGNDDSKLKALFVSNRYSVYDNSVLCFTPGIVWFCCFVRVSEQKCKLMVPDIKRHWTIEKWLADDEKLLKETLRIPCLHSVWDSDKHLPLDKQTTLENLASVTVFMAKDDEGIPTSTVKREVREALAEVGITKTTTSASSVTQDHAIRAVPFNDFSPAESETFENLPDEKQQFPDKNNGKNWKEVEEFQPLIWPWLKRKFEDNKSIDNESIDFLLKSGTKLIGRYYDTRHDVTAQDDIQVVDTQRGIVLVGVEVKVPTNAQFPGNNWHKVKPQIVAPLMHLLNREHLNPAHYVLTKGETSFLFRACKANGKTMFYKSPPMLGAAKLASIILYACKKTQKEQNIHLGTVVEETSVVHTPTEDEKSN